MTSELHREAREWCALMTGETEGARLVRELLAENDDLQNRVEWGRRGLKQAGERLDAAERATQAVTAERNVAQAKVERARDLATRWERETAGDLGEDWRVIRLRQALSDTHDEKEK